MAQPSVNWHSILLQSAKEWDINDPIIWTQALSDKITIEQLETA